MLSAAKAWAQGRSPYWRLALLALLGWDGLRHLKDPDAADPYINVWVVRAEDKDNPVYQKLVEIYHDKTVTDELLKENGGTAILSDKTPERLQEILSGLEDLVKQNS